MKKLFFLLPVLSLVFSCHIKENQDFTIQVTLKNAPLQSVTLEEIEPESIKTIDSSKISDAYGKFTFHGVISSEGLYRIHFQNHQEIFLALGPGHVQIDGDYLHLDQLKIKGSPATVSLQRLLAQLNQQGKVAHQLAQNFDSLRAAKVNDSILVIKNQQYLDAQKQMTQTIEQFADSTQSPAGEVFALSLLQPEQLADAKGIFDHMMKKFPNSPIVDSLYAEYQKFSNNAAAMEPASSLTVGQSAPDISLPSPDGKILSLSSFRGKYVLVDFWASWCPPCRAENPNVVKAYQAFKGKNFTIFSVSLDTKKQSWIKAIAQDHLTWNHVSDLKGWNSAPAAAYGVTAIPANFLLDPQGKVIATDLRGDDLENELQTVLK
ncbi:MAG: redoxin domain-containing protein [Chitinophagaceae bacterium]